jgi:BTB/POZ domain-containing protein KCTD9
MRNVKLDRADLTSASLALADLTGASLRSAQLHGTDFSGANIEGVIFTQANVFEALNLDAARNAKAAIWEDQPAADSKP